MFKLFIETNEENKNAIHSRIEARCLMETFKHVVQEMEKVDADFDIIFQKRGNIICQALSDNPANPHFEKVSEHTSIRWIKPELPKVRCSS